MLASFLLAFDLKILAIQGKIGYQKEEEYENTNTI